MKQLRWPKRKQMQMLTTNHLSSAQLGWLTSHLIVIGCLSKRLLLGFYCEIFQLALILYKRVTYSI